MVKADIVSNPLIPVALVAGILSGSLWRSGPTVDQGKPGNALANADRLESASGGSQWISALRPVMDTLEATLSGGSVLPSDPEVQFPEPPQLLPKGQARDAQISEVMATLRTGLDRLASPSEQTCGDVATLQPLPNGLSLHAAAAVLGTWLLTDEAAAKEGAAAAKMLRDEYDDWKLLQGLAKRAQHKSDDSAAPGYDVDFMVASIPDYVDSSSGWVADQELAALQSAMAEQDFVFDRVRLIDWSRSQVAASSVVASSFLHEQQPGAIIFRKVGHDERTVHVQVALVVLETPTAGVHQLALRNSLWFLRAWDACTKRTPLLRVLGPSFSGSTLSLAAVIGEAPFKAAFAPRIVITGSATAGENPGIMQRFSNGAIFGATVQPTAVLQERMARFLESVNPEWKDGNRVALLVESNTVFGRDVSGRAGDDQTPSGPFKNAKVFQFPLHVAQLRSDASALEQPAAVLSGPVIPLDMREAVPPSDLIPALQPQLTSAVVNSTVDSILDAIRHEKLTAVGILATDDRDVLFLSREVKRACPDVQLFLFGAHGLYLHPDFVPYLRGALVASSYALTLSNQPEIAGSSHHPEMRQPPTRQPFPSMSAEGIFYAVRALLNASTKIDGDTLPYCPDGKTTNCVPDPPVSINVLGEDGYWTLTAAKDPVSNATPQRIDPYQVGELSIAPLPGLPLPFAIGALVVLAILTFHLYVIYRTNHPTTKENADQAFLELPFVRVLVPPQTFHPAASYHRFTVCICLALLALAAAWVEAIVMPFLVGVTVPRSSIVVAVTVLTTVLLIAYAGFHLDPRRVLSVPHLPRPTQTEPDRSIDRRSIGVMIGSALFGGMLVTMFLFLLIVWQALAGLLGDLEWPLKLARIVGGGIVSPAAITICLAAAFYTAVMTSARRLSLVGYGYSQLAQGSSTFSLFAGRRQWSTVSDPQPGSFAAMLDMPVQNMAPVYSLLLLLFMVVGVLATWRVSTIDGRTFSWFLSFATWTTLGLGLMQLVQGAALWNTARSHLKQLAGTPIESRLGDIAAHVPWNISLAPPRLTELTPVARMADMVVRDFRTLGLEDPHTRGGVDMCRNVQDFSSVQFEAERRLGMRHGDLRGKKRLFSPPGYLDLLQIEMSTHQQVALIQSTTWLALWQLSDELVTLLGATAWQRSSIVWCRIEAAVLAATDTEGQRVVIPQPPPRFAGRSLQSPTPVDDCPSAEQRDGWFKRCEELIALEMAFVLRDVVARTVTCLFAAMLCLTLLTSAHLFYTFNGRTSMLAIDMLAVAATALVSVWMLVDMERDHVLSRLRSTRPGTIDLNWEFVKRIAVYGVLPLLAVIAALFPEVGGTLFGWLEPLRKLWAF
jgi:hypothetical protein